MSAGEYQEHLDEIVQEAEVSLAAEVGGRESVVMLAPMGAHNAIAVEAWQAVTQWDLQTDDDNVVQAVRYGALPGDPEHTQTLTNLKSRISAATTTTQGRTSRVSGSATANRIANASGLTQYYRDIGAYGDITPGDGATTTFTPAPPPPAYACTSGTAVVNPGSNLGAVHDCEALLDSKDTLRGAGSLNWATSTAIGSWDGVTTAGTPLRVTKVELDDEDLTGTIPAALGSLFELTHLDFSSNSLTGEIPTELGWLHNLTSIKLSGNSLTASADTGFDREWRTPPAAPERVGCLPQWMGRPSVKVRPESQGRQQNGDHVGLFLPEGPPIHSTGGHLPRCKENELR